jgi:hypothetical protein
MCPDWGDPRRLRSTVVAAACKTAGQDTRMDNVIVCRKAQPDTEGIETEFVIPSRSSGQGTCKVSCSFSGSDDLFVFVLVRRRTLRLVQRSLPFPTWWLSRQVTAWFQVSAWGPVRPRSCSGSRQGPRWLMRSCAARFGIRCRCRIPMTVLPDGGLGLERPADAARVLPEEDITDVMGAFRWPYAPAGRRSRRA